MNATFHCLTYQLLMDSLLFLCSKYNFCRKWRRWEWSRSCCLLDYWLGI